VDNILYYHETIKLVNYSIFKKNASPKRNFTNKLYFWKQGDKNHRPKEHDVYFLGNILFQLTQHVNSYNGNWEKYLKDNPPEHRESLMRNISDKYKKICKGTVCEK